METEEQKQERVTRALARIKVILDEEQCELEPFLLMSQGIVLKKEINVVPRKIPATPEQPKTEIDTEGETN